jgi:hypothetical protein
MIALFVQTLSLVLFSALLGGAIAFHRAPSLAHLEPPPMTEKDTADLAETLSQVVIKQAGRQTVEEVEINRFLTTVLSARQEGLTEGLAVRQRVLCDLLEDSARLHFVWGIGPHTVHGAVEVRLARVGEHLVFDVIGGSYGSLRVSRVFLSPLRPALDRLAEACQPEIAALLTLPRLSIAKEKLVLDPTF